MNHFQVNLGRWGGALDGVEAQHASRKDPVRRERCRDATCRPQLERGGYGVYVEAVYTDRSLQDCSRFLQ